MAAPLPPLTQIPADLVSLEDYAAYARPRMSEAAWAYLSGGAADELTLAENRHAFDRLRLRPRVLADLRQADTGLELLGQRLAHPILLAPVASQRLFHAQAEYATLQAAALLEAPMVVSTQASVSLEALAEQGGAPLWFQLYVQPDRAFTAQLVRRVQAAGYRALVVTVDAPVAGVRNREQRAGFHLQPPCEAPNLAGMRLPPLKMEAGLFGSGLLEGAARWEDIAWLREQSDLPILLKGILTGEDAQRALAVGVDGLIVSNHGGRTLDGVPATIEVLPEVIAAVQGRVPVLLDGGVRRGTDVLKALALGARAVLIGRPYVYGLATAGALGVAHVLRTLREELEVAMALSGRARLAEIDETLIWRGPRL